MKIARDTDQPPGLCWGVICGLVTLVAAASLQAAELDSQLAAELQRLGGGDKANVIVFMKKQADRSTWAQPSQTRAEQRHAVIEALREIAAITQPPVLAELAAAQAKGRVEALRKFWIFNGFSMKATKSVILALASRSDVGLIVRERMVKLPPLLPGKKEEAIQAAEWNVSKIRAPEVWAMGFRGGGTVVANIDSGVFKEHPDLISQYRGGTNSWFDAVNGQPDPYDDNGHGTHTIGTIVGTNLGGTDIGVAPEAQWIACKGFDAEGSGTSTQLLQCMEWVVDPDGDPVTDDGADVVNNSWSTAPGCFKEFEPAVKVWVAAGIFPIFSAGNSGPGFFTGASPAVYPSAFAVGATDMNDQIASFSSRGPSSCDGTIFPEVSAPGVNIRSTWPDGGYRNLSGTSMAAPHMAGCAALMLSTKRRPILEILRLQVPIVEILVMKTSVDLGRPGRDNNFGAGRLDCFESVNRWK